MPPVHTETVQGSQQVNIRVRFAEVSRTDMLTLGISWQEFNAGRLSGGGGSSAYIDNLQRTGVLNVIAEPNLTAVSGQDASFLAGGEYPVPVPSPGGGITMTYKPYGVQLNFTPTLLKNNIIALHVHPEVSMISEEAGLMIGGIKVPAFQVRRSDTTIELGSGQTIALAGLFERQLAPGGVEKAPILGDLPVIGALFRSERYQRHETELVILITPYLVKPVSDHSLADPTQRAAPPPPPPPPPPPAGPPSEPVGEYAEPPEVPPAPPSRPSMNETRDAGSAFGLILK
jgi:pilus assembly protein CpaC